MIGSRKIKEKLERIFRKLFLARPFLAITVALILGPAAFLFFQCYYSPDVPFIFNHSNAAWIRYPEPVSTYTRVYTDTPISQKNFTLTRDPVGEGLCSFKGLRESKTLCERNSRFPESLQEKNWKKGTQIKFPNGSNQGRIPSGLRSKTL